MTHKFVTLRVWHPDCWMLELCDRHRDVSVESRGVSTRGDCVHTDALLQAKSHQALEDALAARVPHDVKRHILNVGHEDAEVYSSYPTYRSIYEATVRTGFLVVGPVLHEQGYERWEVLADSDSLDAGVSMLRESGGEVRVERIRETRSPAPRGAAGVLGRVGHALSDRQFEILQRAVDDGYYDWPRGKNVKKLAAELGISGPTCLEHIRRAESRIVPAIMEELSRARRKRVR